jgi:hypothetical protein
MRFVATASPSADACRHSASSTAWFRFLHHLPSLWQHQEVPVFAVQISADASATAAALRTHLSHRVRAKFD